jgi:ATP-dependent Clp endopeptidase proteolytic subunit ClpP
MADKNWVFDVRGESTDTLEIDVYDQIGKSWTGEGVTAKDVRDKLKEAKGAKSIQLRVNSGGGSVFEGLAIYNLLVQHPAKVVAHVDALAASMASVIIMAADEINVAESAMIMIHAPWSYAVGNAEDMRQQADLLDKLKEQLIDIYAAANGKIDREKITELVAAETWMTGSEAIENGFAHKITKSKAAAQMLASLDVRDFSNMPAVFARVVEDARKETKKVQAPSAPQAEAPVRAVGETQKGKSMTRDELRAQHPALYQACVDEGRDNERKRVNAHIKLAKTHGATDVAFAAIEAGKSVQDDDVYADYMSAGFAKRDRDNRQTDSDNAGEALNGAATTPPAGAAGAGAQGDLGDQVAALMAAERGGK